MRISGLNEGFRPVPFYGPKLLEDRAEADVLPGKQKTDAGGIGFLRCGPAGPGSDATVHRQQACR